MQRAYSILHVKAVDGDRRVIAGFATTPTVDRMGDIVEPRGAKFANPLPLLLFHDSRMPVGTAKFARPTDDGIAFEAHIPEIAEPGTLRDRVEEAWQSIKAGLIRGVSIGFRTLDDGIEQLKTGGLRFTSTEILELSLVAIPANSEATITTIRSLDAAHLAASGTATGTSPNTPGATGTRVVQVNTYTRGASMKTYSEQIAAMEATRQAKAAELDTLQNKVSGEGRTKDASEREQFNGIQAEIESIDAELVDLRKMEKMTVAKAVPVAGTSVDAAAQARSGSPVITVRDNLPPGIGFARAIMCQVHARLDGYNVLEVAKARYPDHQALHNFLAVKAAVPGGTTTETTFAAPLVYATNLASEFIEYMRPMTLIGKIPGLTRVPFHVRVPSQTNGGNGYWVGEGAAKPLTKFEFENVTLGYTKVANIAVLTEELLRFSNPSAEAIVRDQLAAALIARLDTDFVDPTKAEVSGVSPASIINGVAGISSTGSDADAVRADLRALFAAYIAANVTPSSAVILMTATTALALSLMTNALGQPEFPNVNMNGGTLNGIPVIVSEYLDNSAGSAGGQVIMVNAQDVYLADDGQVQLDASREASLQMDTEPTNSAASGTGASLVSMFQTNSVAIRAERFINWKKRRSSAAQWLDAVTWGQ
jgi:HK97 family phage major capsid protein/HK97 family phage prohead protease